MAIDSEDATQHSATPPEDLASGRHQKPIGVSISQL